MHFVRALTAIIFLSECSVILSAENLCERVFKTNTFFHINCHIQIFFSYIQLTFHPVKTEYVFFGTQQRIASATLSDGPFSLFLGDKPINQEQCVNVFVPGEMTINIYS